MSKAYILIVCLIFSFSILSEGKEIPVNGDKSILDCYPMRRRPIETRFIKVIGWAP